MGFSAICEILDVIERNDGRFQVIGIDEDMVSVSETWDTNPWADYEPRPFDGRDVVLDSDIPF